ncbi:MAG: enoyl-CoA hydratase/isomerase family protein [Planctomycetota bacterium]|jgi:methylglutaconyl-CoA hydratase
MIKIRDVGPVRWLVLNRPDKRNALDANMVTELLDALDDCGNARCVAITGEGKAFSAGADLSALQRMKSASYEDNLADSRHLAALFTRIAEHDLPVIAAVNGHAIAGGAGLALACDFTYSVRDAQFGFTEVRIGFIPAIVMNFLVRIAGEKVARDLCLTGRRITPGEAARLGLLTVVDDLEGAVARIGDEIASCSPAAVARTKRHFLEIRPLDLDASAQANAQARATEDCQEGIASFLEKRKPRWQG